MLKTTLRALACAALLAGSACAQQVTEGPSGASIGPEAATEVLTVETDSGPVRLNVEIADDEQERDHGLMFRETLPDDRGMLFDFPQPRSVTFWMHNTPLSLDIIFIGTDGRILNIADNAPPYSDETIPSAGVVRGVLELRAGRAEAMGIRRGQRVRHRIFPS